MATQAAALIETNPGQRLTSLPSSRADASASSRSFFAALSSGLQGGRCCHMQVFSWEPNLCCEQTACETVVSQC